MKIDHKTFVCFEIILHFRLQKPLLRKKEECFYIVYPLPAVRPSFTKLVNDIYLSNLEF